MAQSANGLWMLLGLESWYHNLPAVVPDTGPFNHYFVREPRHRIRS